MRRIEAEHEPIEKPAPAAGTLEEQAIHQRGQPHHTELLPQRRLAAHRFAVDTYDPALAGCGVMARPESDDPTPRHDDGGNSPAVGQAFVISRMVAAIKISEPGPAQPAARREKG